VALRIGLPVFVQPKAGPARPVLVWHAELRNSGTISLRLKNEGNAHIQVSEVAMYEPGAKEPVASHASLSYVLPGQSRAWELKARDGALKANKRFQLKASTDAGSIETGIELAP